MSATDTTGPTPIFTSAEAVRISLHRLLSARAHPTFAGYLCVCRSARAAGRTTELKPDFKAFFDDFLRIAGAPEKRPYVMPFSQTRSPFFNRNVAGSYAPSSLRTVSPFRQVVVVSGSRADAVYSLVPDHATKAKSHMLGGKPLPVASLAIFLYRDYDLLLDSPRCSEIIEIFRNEFGFRQELDTERQAYNQLFIDDSSQFNPAELFI